MTLPADIPDKTLRGTAKLMKLYKYRDFSNPSDTDFARLETLLSGQAFWCARPDTLNDPVEFAWTCDYSTTAETMDLLTELLIRAHGRTREEARDLVARKVEARGLETLAQASIADIIQKCRNEIGLVCFGTSPDNEILWQRYGGAGAGVCIELDVPENLLEVQLHRVQYLDAKTIHIDQLIRAYLDRTHGGEVYTLALLSKPSSWAAEAEIRFVSQVQGVSVVVDGSQITRLILGDALPPSVRQRIEAIATGLPVASRTRQQERQT
jgi:hypothetical protein